MNFFNAFAASFGSLLLINALTSAWLFRSSGAPLIAKIAAPALIVALACTTPYQVNTILGFPMLASPATLPGHAELIAFVVHDDDARVDLWLRQSNAPPRAYESALNENLKRILRESKSRLEHGGRVILVKASPGRGRTGITEHSVLDAASYELDDSFSLLPQKD